MRKTPPLLFPKVVYKSLFVLFAALLSFVPAHASYPYVTNYKKSDYKAGTQNWAITQNDGGFMYFANNNGLLEFDGRKWDCLPILNRTNIRSIFYDAESGRIYAGAFFEFGYYCLDEGGAMGYHSLMDAFSGITDMTEIWNISKIDGTFYLQDDSRIYIYDGENVKTVDAQAKINCSAAVDGTLYVACEDRGVLQLRGDKFVVASWSRQFLGRKVSAILPYQGNRIIFVTEFDGIYAYTGRSLERLRFSADDRVSSAQVFCAATDGMRIAVGTVTDGVFLVNPEEPQWYEHLNTASGMQNNSVLSLYFDKIGDLWAGLDRGVDYIATESPVTSIFGSDKEFGTGYTSIVHNGRLYLGTNQGLYYMDFQDSHRPESEPGIRSVKGINGQVWSLSELDGDLLCGQDKGLFVVKGDNARQISGLDGIWNVIEYGDNPRLALGCSYTGLFFIEKTGGEWRLKHFLKGFDESSVTFVADEDGSIWFHHWMKGLFRLSLNEAADSVDRVEYFDKNSGFPTDRNNIVNKYGNSVVFSSEGGFYKYDAESGRMSPVEKLNGLFNRPPVAAKVVESPYGDLMFLSGTMQALATKENSGLVLDSVSLKFMQDERIPGFDHINWIGRRKFIINTENGFSLVDLDRMVRSRFVRDNNVVIKKVNLMGRPDSAVFGSRGRRSTGDSLSLRPKFTHRENSLEFEFVAPKYDRDRTVQYSCTLEHYDKTWSEWSEDNTKEYTKLPSGNYVFRVKARTMYSQDVSVASFSFTVLPPWYFGTAAICVYALIFALLVMGLVMWINARIRHQTVDIKRQKEEEIRAQSLKFEAEAEEKDREIVMLKNRGLEDDLRHKSQDLADSTMNLIRKNDILIRIKNNLDRVYAEVQGKEDGNDILKRIQKIREDIVENIEHDDDWQKFSSNFDMVYEDYLKRLKQDFPQLTVRDLRLCAFLKMDLSSKDIASMLNMSVRSVEMARYRLRQKMEFSRDTNLSDFLQNF